ncbi:uncharacterized protein LOC117498622 isoform X3 [Trematomus bernacchii]|uniref:uncharacterized protein LOC117498622 isoform X3 n=1 Tax=Trematomus bernacchii TaxID=40690 RepID=UPI00146C450A|nr:uncharacterized protein LOC117498622 isoform X3 [Trematomus bernacchii]
MPRLWPHPGHTLGHTKHPHHHPQIRSPLNSPPPTGVNNGIPSKEEPSKVVNKRKGKLVYQMVVTGTTFGAHDQLTEKVKNEVKDQFDLVQSNSNDYDVTIVFCPIVSRMGPDVESALRDVKGNKPVILVLMHHAYEAKFIPNVQQGANVQLQVNVFFHETKHGLLHCGENGAVVCEITKYLKEIPIPNAQVVATSWPHRWPHQTPSPPPSNQKPVKQPPPTGVNNGIPSKGSSDDRKDTSDQQPPPKKEPSKVVNKWKAKLVYQMVVTGTTFDAHVQLMEKVKKDVKDQFNLVQSNSDDYDVTIVFCPIVSHMGPDVESAMRDVKVSSGDKPVILVLMHHAYETKFIPNVQQGANVQLQVNVFFHETKHGLLHCRENGAAVCEITKYLKEIPIPNAQVVAAAVAELPGGWESACCPPRWPHQTPSNQKPVKQPPPTGVNNGIPSKEEPSKVVNKWKAKLMYQMVVTGTTFDAHVQLMEKVKKDVKDQFDLVQSYSNDYDVTIVFCPIVSRMGPDVESAMRDVQVSSGNKPVILVLMHHAYEAKFIPNVQQGANVQLQVNVFFHETKHGLLHCGENGAVVCEIIKHLKEIPITNAQVVAAAVAELPGGWESACCPPRWPHQTPSNQKPVKQPPPTGVNNGIPSKEEPSKVVNKWKAKLMYQMVVTGTTFDAHVQLMEKVKKDVKDQFDLVQSYSNDYDVTIVFCPIVSRMGPDVESAMRDVQVSSGNKPVILVLMHHAYEAKFIPNVQQGANVQLQVNVFFHETKHGLLHCGENGAVVCEIIKHLKEIPITNAQVVAAAVAELPGGWESACCPPRWPHQTPSNQKPVKQPPPTGVNNGIPSKEPSKVVNKWKAKLVYQMVVTGTTFDAHVQLMEKVKKDVKDQFDLVQSNSDDYDVTIVFCPIVYRMGPDVESAMRDVKGDKPVILVLMHHAYEAKFIPNVQQGANVQLQVNVFFHETKHGLLNCGENGAVVCEITKYLKEIPITNAQVVAAAVAELPGSWEWASWTPRWLH